MCEKTDSKCTSAVALPCIPCRSPIVSSYNGCCCSPAKVQLVAAKVKMESKQKMQEVGKGWKSTNAFWIWGLGSIGPTCIASTFALRAHPHTPCIRCGTGGRIWPFNIIYLPCAWYYRTSHTITQEIYMCHYYICESLILSSNFSLVTQWSTRIFLFYFYFLFLLTWTLHVHRYSRPRVHACCCAWRVFCIDAFLPYRPTQIRSVHVRWAKIFVGHLGGKPIALFAISPCMWTFLFGP